MATEILSSLLVLLQLICVIVVVAYLVSRRQFFNDVLDGHPAIKIQVLLILVFGALSVYGTVAGVEFMGAFINVRDLGPMVAGLIGGPVVGVGAGLIGAAYRMSLGGFTVYACSLATLLAGLFGGLIWLFNKRKFIGLTGAVIFAVAMEALHMILVLLMCQPFEQALELVETIAIPMILANAAGMFVFALIIQNIQNERKMLAERDDLVREMERKNTELAIAAEIQQSFLPDKITQIEGFDIAAMSVMAKEVGGDFFDLIPLSGRRLGIMIADVSGKGIPAALFMALSRIVVRVNATWYNAHPAGAIRDSNTIITEDSRQGMFVTLFYGILDSEKRILTYVNAGHNPPVIHRAAGGTFEELPATGIAIGATLDATYTAETVPLAPGDVMVMYTDGITEAENARQDMFGEDRFREVIARSSGLTADEITKQILSEVRNFCGNQPQSDDITLMVIKAR
ncbi:SpoIIE family protein phosphatase [uncultured Methanoregula sp.]|uniref:PP2C family protein-serine/threonine phosphatase n=1 Tax=uncultured Methanoregula sp. TaxID=1005933 RepID=UPI002AAA7395|nr:SpoIIE family protein phosphatase [uncultured Methanoregula sp.]